MWKLKPRRKEQMDNLGCALMIVLVAVASSHRADAFAACQFIMDYLKTQAPFWKKEHRPEGARWVDARDSDDEAAERWRSLKQPRLLKP